MSANGQARLQLRTRRAVQRQRDALLQSIADLHARIRRLEEAGEQTRLSQAYIDLARRLERLWELQ